MAHFGIDMSHDPDVVAGIAANLGISVPMVRQHLQALFAKIGAQNRAEAVAIALRRMLLKI